MNRHSGDGSSFGLFWPVPFEEWLTILVSHFHLLRGKGERECACLVKEEKGEGGFWIKRNRSYKKWGIISQCEWRDTRSPHFLLCNAHSQSRLISNFLSLPRSWQIFSFFRISHPLNPVSFDMLFHVISLNKSSCTIRTFMGFIPTVDFPMAVEGAGIS